MVQEGFWPPKKGKDGEQKQSSRRRKRREFHPKPKQKKKKLPVVFWHGPVEGGGSDYMSPNKKMERWYVLFVSSTNDRRGLISMLF